MELPNALDGGETRTLGTTDDKLHTLHQKNKKLVLPDQKNVLSLPSSVMFTF